jgi:F0F1-type ATP synthase gamma subunit
MPSVKQLQSEELSLNTIGNFFSAYQKLTIYQMSQNRDNTINSRKFFQGLLDTFIDLKQDLKSLMKVDPNNKEVMSFSTLTKNGKTVDVFISFETKFSTSTNREALEFFKNSIEGRETDLVLVGATAKKLFKEMFPEYVQYTYFDMTEKNTELKGNLDLMRHMLQYEQINVYNPYYISLMQQQPQVETISGDIALESDTKTGQEPREVKHFLFEPDKLKILHFFELQIMSNLFQHKIKEAHLANLGSRIATLQHTQDNLEEAIEKVKLLKIKTMRYKANKKQRNRLSGMRFWS